MSLVRLLTAGKSLAGGREEVSRYRVNKRVQLPKFGSTKNPFGPDDQMKPSAQTSSAVSLMSPRNEDGLTLEIRPVESGASMRKLADKAGRASHAVGAQATRATRWLGEWGQKLNPLPYLKTPRGPTRSAMPKFRDVPVQTELSLDRVKVVRNDLTDADLEVVVATTPVASREAQPVFAKGGGEAIGNTLSRLNARFFGARWA